MTTAAPLAASFPRSSLSRKGGLKAGEGRFGVLLLVPALIAFGAIVLWPFLQALSLSL
jgi:multiple sugar transport system permease protein